MDFYTVLDAILELLQRHKRVTYRALKRQFGLDDAYLEDLKAEIIEARQLAVDQDGTMLVWCGDLAAPPPPSTAPVNVQNRTPLTYTPKHLAEKILTSRSALEGERKQVTVLHSGTYSQAITAAQRALALATASGDVVLYTLANCYLGATHQAQGDYRRAIDCCEQTMGSLDRARRHERCGQVILPAVNSCAWLAECHAELGTFSEGHALGEEGLRIAEAVAHPASLMIALWEIGLLALRQGDLHRALPRLERAMRIRNAATRRMPCASSARLSRTVFLQRSSRPKPSTVRPSS
jgi:tetratricopeptide (TPR) repeat protein